MASSRVPLLYLAAWQITAGALAMAAAATAAVPPSVNAAPPQPTSSACTAATGRKLTVGPGQTYATPSAAAAVAASGDAVLISAGDYSGDVAVWPQNNLTLCGSGGRARLFAAGRYAAGKGIWVIQGSNVVVENIEFHDATVPDGNGAGIRAEGSGLTILNSGFYDNQNGILGPNAGDLTIDKSEFARNGAGDGYTHNIYVGTVDRMVITSSFFHEAKVGHNLKSRARQTRIERSYFMDGPGGTSSYLIDVPNGGAVVLRGNLLQKGPAAQNSRLIAYGEEGMPYAANTLELAFNTLVSTLSGGRFIEAAAGVQSVVLTSNLFAGTNGPTLITPGLEGRTTQTGSVVSSADHVPGASNVSAPNFWPDAGLVAQLPTQTKLDPNYTADTPSPYVVRPFTTRAGRRTGAIQSAP